MGRRKMHLIQVDADGDTGKVLCKQRGVSRSLRARYADVALVTCKRCKAIYSRECERYFQETK